MTFTCICRYYDDLYKHTTNTDVLTSGQSKVHLIYNLVKQFNLVKYIVKVFHKEAEHK